MKCYPLLKILLGDLAALLLCLFSERVQTLIVMLGKMAADMSSTAFIEALPVVDFVSQLLNKDVSRHLSDADRIKVGLIWRVYTCLAKQ